MKVARTWIDHHPGAAFAAANGLFGVIGGAAMLFAGAPGGQSCLVIGCGAALLTGAYLIAFDVQLQPAPAALGVASVAVLLFAVASLYLTHRAEDLPRLLPGHDADSQHLLVLRGAGTALLACVALRAACLRACHAPGRATF